MKECTTILLEGVVHRGKSTIVLFEHITAAKVNGASKPPVLCQHLAQGESRDDDCQRPSTQHGARFESSPVQLASVLEFPEMCKFSRKAREIVHIQHELQSLGTLA
jgi:hypothetical protein